MPRAEQKIFALSLASALTALLLACGPNNEPPDNADVIVVGAGIGGVAAALEAAANGARVIVIESNSVPGGASVRADGIALVDTSLQRKKGLHDSPEIAFRDLQAWGEDVDPAWAKRFVDSSAREVYDWLTSLGVRFTIIADTEEDTVPRLHRTQGGAIEIIVAMMHAALAQPRIEFAWNTTVSDILRENQQIVGVRTHRTRGGKADRIYRAPAVVLATGGFESDLEFVRSAWSAALPPPERLLIGSSQNATGSGLRLAKELGAMLSRLDHQEVYVAGVPDPRDSRGDRGLQAGNPAAIWVDSTGRRFTNEAAPTKLNERAVLKKTPATYWMIFDAGGREHFTLTGAAWLNSQTIAREILANPAIVKRADSVAGLAAVAGLPPDALIDTVQRYNLFLEQKSDTDFGRIGPGTPETTPRLIREPPFFAIQLFPATRKSMGGVVIDEGGRVLDRDRQPIPGLYACGEVAGAAGINGSYGGSGMFLGPAVLTGRIAARSATDFAHARTADANSPGDTPPAPMPIQPDRSPASATSGRVTFQPGVLTQLLKQSRPGYWHFEAAHRLVVERNTNCGTCHSEAWPISQALTREQTDLELSSCARCH